MTYNLDIRKQRELTGNEDKSADYPEKYDIEKIKLTGFLAQNVADAAKKCGYDFSGVREPVSAKGLYTVSYEQFVVPLVKGMQEQQQMIEAQQHQIKDLMKRIELLEKGKTAR